MLDGLADEVEQCESLILCGVNCLISPAAEENLSRWYLPLDS